MRKSGFVRTNVPLREERKGGASVFALPAGGEIMQPRQDNRGQSLDETAQMALDLLDFPWI